MSTPEERAEIREKFDGFIVANMGVSFAQAAIRDGGLSIDIAIAGCVAMCEFGLVLAERHPELAATLREAAREDDEAKGLPISTGEAVDAVAERMA